MGNKNQRKNHEIYENKLFHVFVENVTKWTLTWHMVQQKNTMLNALEVAKQQAEKVWSEQFTHFQLRQQQGYQFLAAWPGNTKWWSFLLTIAMTEWTDRYFCCFFHLQRMFSPCLFFSRPLAFLTNSISAAEAIFSLRLNKALQGEASRYYLPSYRCWARTSATYAIKNSTLHFVISFLGKLGSHIKP